MAKHTFIVWGKAVPWSVSAGGHFGRSYKPTKLNKWQEVVYLAARDQLAVEELEGPMRLDMVIGVKRPKSRSRDQPDRYIPHIVRPDRVNYAKAIEDALVKPPEQFVKPLLADDKWVWLGETAKVWNPVGIGHFAIGILETDVDDAEDELERMGVIDILPGLS